MQSVTVIENIAYIKFNDVNLSADLRTAKFIEARLNKKVLDITKFIFTDMEKIKSMVSSNSGRQYMQSIDNNTLEVQYGATFSINGTDTYVETFVLTFTSVDIESVIKMYDRAVMRGRAFIHSPPVAPIAHYVFTSKDTYNLIVYKARTGHVAQYVNLNVSDSLYELGIGGLYRFCDGDHIDRRAMADNFVNDKISSAYCAIVDGFHDRGVDLAIGVIPELSPRVVIYRDRMSLYSKGAAGASNVYLNDHFVSVERPYCAECLADVDDPCEYHRTDRDEKSCLREKFSDYADMPLFDIANHFMTALGQKELFDKLVEKCDDLLSHQ